MNTYLAIITTVLVVTQIIRLIQNAVQLHRQNVLFRKQLGQIEDVTQEDLDMQRKAYRLIVDYLQEGEDNLWKGRFEDLYGSDERKAD